MSPVPYLPAGVSELPAERFLLFADTAHLVQRIDEANKQKNLTSFTGFWESPTLNQVEDGFEYTLSELMLFYGAEANTTLTIRASGDGGDTWAEVQVVNLLATVDEIKRVMAGFNVTGFDVRFRIEFDTDVLVNVYGYRPTLIKRSDLVL